MMDQQAGTPSQGRRYGKLSLILGIVVMAVDLAYLGLMVFLAVVPNALGVAETMGWFGGCILLPALLVNAAGVSLGIRALRSPPDVRDRHLAGLGITLNGLPFFVCCGLSALLWFAASR